MKLTTEQIKQIIKEEVKKVLLGENLYKTNLQKWKEKSSKEPEAWLAESDQYFQMLEEEKYDEFLFAVYDDLPMLAYILSVSGLLHNDAERFLGSIGKIDDGAPGQLIKDYINRPLQKLKLYFANFYNEGKGSTAMRRSASKKVVDFLLEDFLFGENVLLGYLGVISVRMGLAGQIIMTLKEENMNENAKFIRNMWHDSPYQLSGVPQQRGFNIMVSPIKQSASETPMIKFDYIGENELVLGIDENWQQENQHLFDNL